MSLILPKLIKESDLGQDLKDLPIGIHFDRSSVPEQWHWGYYCRFNASSNLNAPTLNSWPVDILISERDLTITTFRTPSHIYALIDTGRSLQLKEFGSIVLKVTYEWTTKCTHESSVFGLTGLLESDEKFSKYSITNDETDRQSPDSIIRDQTHHSQYRVLEVKTKIADHGNFATGLEAMAKYRKAVLERRKTGEWDLFYIVLSHGFLIHNFTENIPVEVYRYWYKMYFIGRAFWQIMRGSGFMNVAKKQEFDEFRAGFLTQMKAVGQPIDLSQTTEHGSYNKNYKNLIINREKWDQWRSKSYDLNNIISNVVAVAQTTFLNNVKTLPDIDQREEDLKFYDDKINEFKKEWISCNAGTKYEGTRPKDDRKPVVIWPFLVAHVAPNYESSHFDKVPILGKLSSGDRNIYEVWSTAISSRISFPDNFMQREDYENLLPEEKKKLRNNYKRVRVFELEEDVLKNIALQGIWAKSRKWDHDLQYKRAQNKKPFHPDVDCSDVSLFLQRPWTFLPESNDITEHVAKEVLESARSTHSDSPLSKIPKQFVETYYQTDIGSASQIIELIAEELNLSLAQKCKPKSMIMKQLPFYNIHMLIVPTTQTGPLFFSLLVKRSDFPESFLPFRTPKAMTNDYMIYDFVSVNRQKIVQVLGFSKKMCFDLAFWAQDHKCGFTTDAWQTNDDLKKHHLFSYLLHLEDKGQTSASLQNIRYMYTKTCAETDVDWNPGLLYSKFEPYPRSRLYVWSLRNIFTAFRLMVKHKPNMISRSNTEEQADYLLELETTEEVVASHDDFSNLYSWVTLSPIKRFSTALSLSYLGVHHNKDEIDPVMSQFLIFQKTIKEERSLRDCDPSRLAGIPDYSAKMKSHEWNEDFVIAAADRIKRVLAKTGRISGDFSYNEYFEDIMCKHFFKVQSSDYATFKASCSPPKSDQYEIVVSGKENNKRKRCLERILELMIEGKIGINPFLHMDELLSVVESHGGVIIDLFQKPQWNGVREILVMMMEGRLVVSWLEHVSRTLSSILDNEMLTRGKFKHRVVKLHAASVRKSMHEGDASITTTDSDDASTWCQGFTMPMFGAFLSRILPESFINPAIRVLNVMTMKKLILPNNLLFLFSTNSAQTSFSEEINDLKDQFLGRSSNTDLVIPGKNYMMNSSNMGQGILHYTSSLYHSAMMEFYEEMCELYCEQAKVNHPEIKSLLVTTQVSSDDSGVIRTLIINGPRSPIHSSILKFLTYLKQALYPFFGAKHSKEKSTSGSRNGFYEFNSDYYMGNEEITVLIKFCIAAIGAKSSTRLESRVISCVELRRQILQNGGTFYLTGICQELQAKVHYDMLGAHMRPEFEVTSKMLSVLRHPILGFFPLEEPTFNSFFGYRYLLYREVVKSELTAYVEQVIYKTGDVVFDELGRPSFNVRMLMSSNRRYYSFLERVETTTELNREDWQEYFEVNPHLFFLPARTSIEMLYKVLRVPYGPGAENAMVFNSASHMYAMSVYMVDTKSVTVREYEAESKMMKATKTSFGSFLSDMLTMMIQELPSQQVVAINPLVHEKRETFDPIIRMADDFARSRIIPIRNSRPMRPLEVTMEQTFTTPKSLLDCVIFKWFRYNPDEATAAFRQSWKTFQEKFIWLQNTWEETLMHPSNPFLGNSSAFADYLLSWNHKTHTSLILTNSPRVRTPMNQTQLFMSYCVDPAGIISFDTLGDYHNQVFHSMNELSENLTLILSSPLTLQEKKDRCIDVMEKPEFNNLDSLIAFRSSLSRRDRALLSMLRFMRDQDFEILTSQVSATHRISWVRPQERDITGQWYGEGTLQITMLDGVETSYELGIYNNMIERIFTTFEASTQIPARHSKVLQEVIENANFQPFIYLGRQHDRRVRYYSIGDHQLKSEYVKGYIPMIRVTNMMTMDVDQVVITVENDCIALGLSTHVRAKFDCGILSNFRLRPFAYWKPEGDVFYPGVKEEEITNREISVANMLGSISDDDPERDFLIHEYMNQAAGLFLNNWLNKTSVSRRLGLAFLRELTQEMCDNNEEFKFWRLSLTSSVFRGWFGALPIGQIKEYYPDIDNEPIQPAVLLAPPPALILTSDLDSENRELDPRQILSSVEENQVDVDPFTAFQNESSRSEDFRVSMFSNHPIWNEVSSEISFILKDLNKNTFVLLNNGELEKIPEIEFRPRLNQLRKCLTNWARVSNISRFDLMEEELSL